jgi:TatD DNase family protein
VIDTHAHLDACDGSPGDVLARARSAGVDRVLTVGTTVAGCRHALELAERHEEVHAVLGIHPHEAGQAEEDAVEAVADLLGHPCAVAVGETGLDFFRDYAPRDAQRRLFERLLDLACETGKPTVIHTRGADEETRALLRDHPGTVVLHCFSSPALLEPALERGWYVSFAGNVSYPKATALRLAATQVPDDRLLAETDAPYLAPQPVRGRRNEPAFVVHTVEALARARGEEAAALGERIERNAIACFGLPE